jgi:diaminopimelate decarboxylase
MLTDGLRLDSGAARYAVARQNTQNWVGIKTHMGYNQEAYDAECAALARALEVAARRGGNIGEGHNLHRRSGGHSGYGFGGASPGQMYALQVRSHIAILRRARPDIIIEIRWCPAHKGIAGDEKADQ